MLQSSPRTWVAGTAVVLALVVVGVWLLLVSPLRAEAAQQREEVAGAETTNAVVSARTAQLQRQFADLPAEQAKLDALRAAMPEDAELPSLVRGLQTLADSAGVTLMSITPGTAVVPGATATAPAAAPTPAPTPAPAGAAPTTTTPAGQVTVRIPVEVAVVGSFAKTELFLRGVQTQLPRAFLVGHLHVHGEEAKAAMDGSPPTVNGDVTMTVSGSVFVLRDAARVNTAVRAPATAPQDPAAALAPAAGATTPAA